VRLEVSGSLKNPIASGIKPVTFPAYSIAPNPVPGGYKYGNLALQVGGVLNETVKYGREFCGTSIQE
jgi:hypothetical protein